MKLASVTGLGLASTYFYDRYVDHVNFSQEKLPDSMPFELRPSKKYGLLDILYEGIRVNMITFGFCNNNSEMQGDQGNQIEIVEQTDNTTVYRYTFDKDEYLNGKPGGRPIIRPAVNAIVDLYVTTKPDNSIQFKPSLVSMKKDRIKNYEVGLTYGLPHGVVGSEIPGSTLFAGNTNIRKSEEERTLGQFRSFPVDRFRTLTVYEEMPIIEFSVSTFLPTFLILENRKNPWVRAHDPIHKRLRKETGYGDWYEMMFSRTYDGDSTFTMSVHPQPPQGEKYSSQDTLERYQRFRRR